MIPTSQPEVTAVHPLARFVTKEAIALLLNLKSAEIYRINCWRYVIHVVGKGVSKFISYADLPPILEVEAPTKQDFVCWRKRWKHKKQAPEFWAKFYKQKFLHAICVTQLYAWGRIVSLIKLVLAPATVKELRTIYAQAKYLLQPDIKRTA